MKKIFTALTFMLIAMLAFNNQANATNVTINLTLTDNLNTLSCPAPYTGNYHVTITIICNGETLCEHQRYDITQGYTEITWNCDGNLSVYDTYTVQVRVCRYIPFNPETCCGGTENSSWTMQNLMDGVPESVTLQ